LKKEILPRKYREYLGLGVEIAASLLLPMIGGFYVDQFFNSSPVGILVGVVVGLILFFLITIRISRRLNSEGGND